MIKHLKTASSSSVARHLGVALVVSLSLVDVALAQVGGGTGTIDAVQTRSLSILSSAQAMLYAFGAILVSGAAMYAGYGIMFGGKKWSELVNVAGGAAVAGMAVMIAGWLFS